MKSQYVFKVCLICNKASGRLLLCANCRKDPFVVEDARKKAASFSNPKIFTQLYFSSYSEIHNKNTKNFWNTYFEEELSLSDQDQMTKEKIKKIVSLLSPGKLNILDIGFGQGYFEEKIVMNRDARVTGIDISTEAVKNAQAKFKGTFIHGNLHDVKKKFPQSSFDVIVAIEVIEHISPKNIFAFFKDVHSLLKPHGTLIISTPLNEHLKDSLDNPSGHVREYTIPVLKKELELSGFRVTHTSTFYAFQNFYFLKKILAKILRNHWEPNNVVLKTVRV